MKKKVFLFLALALLVVGGAFAQRVGETYTLAGQNYTVVSVNGDDVTLRKVAAQTGDGPVNWTAVANSPFGTTTVNAVAYGNNTWVAVGDRGQVAYSADNGRTWTLVPILDSRGNNTTTPFYDVAFGNGRWIAVGNNMDATSTDNGRTWTPIDGIPTNPESAIAFANGRWISAAVAGRTAYSTDGTTWTAVTAADIFGGSNSDFIRGLAFGNNRWVAGSRGPIGYSADGARWTAAGDSAFGTGSGGAIWGIAFGNNRFVAVGANGKIAYSADGAAWTAVPPGSMRDAGQTTFYNGVIQGVAFGNNRFVAVGGDGRIAYSTDGTRWTAVENRTAWQYTNARSQTVQAAPTAVAYGNGRFVAVGTEGKIAYCDW